jgi:hypothetical protein
MGLLRRLFGGGNERHHGARTTTVEDAAPAGAEVDPPTSDDVDAEERARELELLRGEQERLDELIVRQQRYSDRSWVPPSQGGTRRSDDGEASPGEDR